MTDPMNMGSILRSSLFLGVDGIFVNYLNAGGLTSVVSKVSSGALEFIPLYSVRNIKVFLEDAKYNKLKFKLISTNIETISSKEKHIQPSMDDLEIGDGQGTDESKLTSI